MTPLSLSLMILFTALGLTGMAYAIPEIIDGVKALWSEHRAYQGLRRISVQPQYILRGVRYRGRAEVKANH